MGTYTDFHSFASKSSRLRKKEPVILHNKPVNSTASLIPGFNPNDSEPCFKSTSTIPEHTLQKPAFIGVKPSILTSEWVQCSGMITGRSKDLRLNITYFISFLILKLSLPYPKVQDILPNNPEN